MTDNPRGTYEIELHGETRLLQIERVEGGEEPRYRVLIDDAEPIDVQALSPEPGVLSLLAAGRSYEVGVVPLDDAFEIDVLGIPHEVGVIDPRRKALRTAAGAGSAALKTQMPGRVVRILVAEGDDVTKGQPLVVVEAMKMENELKAPQDGTVARILVSEGELLEARTVLIELG